MILKEDKNLIYIDSVYEADILPQTHHDLLKKIHLASGAVVKGSIYGKEIHVKPDVVIWGEVFAKEKISIEHSSDVIFLSSIASKGAILSLSNQKEQKLPQYTLLIYGDVISGIINLHNTLVVGSTYGDEVILKDTFVLGTIYAKEYVDLCNVTSFAFYSQKVRKAEYITSIYPHSIIGVNDPSAIFLRWLPFCILQNNNNCPENRILCEKFKNGTCKDYVKLTPIDQLVIEDITVFTLSKRIVNAFNMKENLENIYNEYKKIFLSSKIQSIDIDKDFPLFGVNTEFLKAFVKLRQEWNKKNLNGEG